MRSLRALLALALALAAAGCTADDESRSAPGEDAQQDSGLLLMQYHDVTAPVASDCTGTGARDPFPAQFTPPDGTRWVRLEAAFTGAQIGLVVMDQDGSRIGYAAGSSPVVVILEESLATGVSQITAKAYACESPSDIPVRVYATFRSAAP